MENRLCGLLDLFLFNMLEWEILVATVPLLIFILPSLMKTPYPFWTVDLPASHLLVLLKESIELLCKGRKRILTLPFLMPALTLEDSRLEAEVKSPSLLSIDCREDGPSRSSIAPSEQCLLGLLLPFKRCFFSVTKKQRIKSRYGSSIATEGMYCIKALQTYLSSVHFLTKFGCFISAHHCCIQMSVESRILQIIKLDTRVRCRTTEPSSQKLRLHRTVKCAIAI